MAVGLVYQGFAEDSDPTFPGLRECGWVRVGWVGVWGLVGGCFGGGGTGRYIPWPRDIYDAPIYMRLFAHGGTTDPLPSESEDVGKPQVAPFLAGNTFFPIPSSTGEISASYPKGRPGHRLDFCS